MHIRQARALTQYMEESNIIILSALVPGEIAPVLITEEMAIKMAPGSVIMDVSIDQGGNCALTEPGKEVWRHRVLVSGLQNIPSSVPVHASWLYSNNMYEYVRNLFKNGIGTLDMDDDIVQHSIVTHDGKILHKGTIKAMNES